MSNSLQTELGETIPRFFNHWVASCFGHFLMVLLPLVAQWPHPAQTSFPKWWSVLLFAGATSLISAVINANLPVTARELVKSVALGFALNATSTMLQIA